MQQANPNNMSSSDDSLRYDKFRRWRDYLRPQPILGYIGDIGYGNFGDDLVFAAIARLFSQQLIAYDGATQTVHCDPKYNLRRRLRLYRRIMKPALFDGVLLGGGTVINRAPFLSRLQQAMVRYPCVTFGSGVCDPSFGQQQVPQAVAQAATDPHQWMDTWAAALQSVRYLGVRGPKSAQILQAYDLDPQVIGDPALSIATPRTDYRRTRRVAIAIESQAVQWGNQDTINQAIQCLCFALHRQGWWVELLAFSDNDVAIATQIAEALFNVFGRPFPYRLASGIPETLDYIKTCDLVMGTHLYATVAAHACGVPAILLCATPQGDDYMASMDLELFTMRTDKLAPTEPCMETLLSLASWVGDRYGEHCQQVRAKVESYQQIQATAAETVSQLLTTPTGETTTGETTIGETTIGETTTGETTTDKTTTE